MKFVISYKWYLVIQWWLYHGSKDCRPLIYPHWNTGVKIFSPCYNWYPLWPSIISTGNTTYLLMNFQRRHYLWIWVLVSTWNTWMGYFFVRDILLSSDGCKFSFYSIQSYDQYLLFCSLFRDIFSMLLCLPGSICLMDTESKILTWFIRRDE